MSLEPVHRLFVNLLPMSFYDAAFIEVEVGNLLTAAGLTPANIVFEITERLAIENFASFKRALGAYTAMGFGVAIDDVGTRHSNLETVMSLRPHFIKISDVLVRGIARSTVKREMLRSLRHIAETIDAVMIAEGIEQLEDVVGAARSRPALRPGLLHGAPRRRRSRRSPMSCAPSCAERCAPRQHAGDPGAGPARRRRGRGRATSDRREARGQPIAMAHGSLHAARSRATCSVAPRTRSRRDFALPGGVPAEAAGRARPRRPARSAGEPARATVAAAHATTRRPARRS